ncbi:MAG TPA: polymer-forming cytoskeletal protein [Candidatus Binataceae bacterium]|nr:polymer-forming cytoskeletal protein [Candidatus Binataceae bacterium]
MVEGDHIAVLRGQESQGARSQNSGASADLLVEERTRVAVGRNVTVSGRLIFSQPVRIEGRFKGEVTSTDLVVIGEEGTIEGKVRAPRLMIMGELRGDVAGANRVVLDSHSRVYGNIETQSLTVREGAHLDGHVSMTGARSAD